MIIDAHHHFWSYKPAAYDWIDESMSRLRQDFLPDDLRPILAACGIDGTVTIQAMQSLEETDWLLRLAADNEFIRGVVGWVPLTDPSIDHLLARYANEGKLKGVRHVLQGQPPGFLDGPAFNRGIRTLHARGLVYDLLIVNHQLEETIRFVDRHPDQAFVLDHIAKPGIREEMLDPWRDHIQTLARRENVTCKLSGLVTEANLRDWSPQDLQPFIDTVLDAFGPRRLMFGSDWPVCLLASDYSRWLDTARACLKPLSAHEQTAIFGGTAVAVYNLQPEARHR